MFTFFSCLFSIFQKNYRLLNTFWLYQDEVRRALFQSYSHFNKKWFGSPCTHYDWTNSTLSIIGHFNTINNGERNLPQSGHIILLQSWFFCACRILTFFSNWFISLALWNTFLSRFFFVVFFSKINYLNVSYLRKVKM